MPMDNINIQLIARRDSTEERREYLFGTTKFPGSIDLNQTLFLVFPHFDKAGNLERADLRVKNYDPNYKRDTTVIKCNNCNTLIPPSNYCPECGCFLSKRKREREHKQEKRNANS